MKLKTDKTHKKIDLKSLKKDGLKKLNISIASLVMSLTLFSGCSKKLNEKPDMGISNSISASDSIDTSGRNIDAAAPSDDLFTDLNDGSYGLSADSVVTYSSENYDSDTIKLNNVVSFDLDGKTYTTISEVSRDNLDSITSINVVLEDGIDYSYLNLLPNLNHIYFIDRFVNGDLSCIDGSIFKNSVDILFEPISTDYVSKFTPEKYSFLKDIPSINSLSVGVNNAYNTSGSFLQSLDNVSNMILNINENTNIKTIDFSNLKSLEIIGEPYNVAIFITPGDIENLKSKGVSVKYNNYDKLVEISSQIDSIYNSLGITEYMSDKNKLDKILNYILNKYTYDEVIQGYNDSGIEHSEATNSFYEDGYLFASLNKTTEICGNYASMDSALCKRANLDSYFLTSNNHAWNAVRVGDYYYFVDPTWMDSSNVVIPIPKEKVNFDNGMSIQTHDYVSKKAEEIFAYGDDYEKANVSWYLEDPFNLPETSIRDESHKLSYVPDGLELVDIPDEIRIDELGIDIRKVYDGSVEYEGVKDITGNMYLVKVNDKKHTVPAFMVASILSSIGIGVLIKRKKDKEDVCIDEVNKSL